MVIGAALPIFKAAVVGAPVGTGRGVTVVDDIPLIAGVAIDVTEGELAEAETVGAPPVPPGSLNPILPLSVCAAVSN